MSKVWISMYFHIFLKSLQFSGSKMLTVCFVEKALKKFLIHKNAYYMQIGIFNHIL